MNRLKSKSLYATPYLVWIIGFIILPMLMVFYYAFTNMNGSFTWNNLSNVTSHVHIAAFILSLLLAFFYYFNMSTSCLSFGTYFKKYEYKAPTHDSFYFHAPYVDELFTSSHGMENDA